MEREIFLQLNFYFMQPSSGMKTFVSGFASHPSVYVCFYSRALLWGVYHVKKKACWVRHTKNPFRCFVLIFVVAFIRPRWRKNELFSLHWIKSIWKNAFLPPLKMLALRLAPQYAQYALFLLLFWLLSACMLYVDASCMFNGFRTAPASEMMFDGE